MNSRISSLKTSIAEIQTGRPSHVGGFTRDKSVGGQLRPKTLATTSHVMVSASYADESAFHNVGRVTDKFDIVSSMGLLRPATTTR